MNTKFSSISSWFCESIEINEIGVVNQQESGPKPISKPYLSIIVSLHMLKSQQEEKFRNV